MRPDGGLDRTRERGWALVSVLWAIAVLAMIAAAMQSLSFSTAVQERHAIDRAAADAALDAAVMRAILGLSDARPAQRWRVDGVAQVYDFGGFRMGVAVQDELGRIDLNAADGTLIAQLLRSQGMERDDAAVLTDRILNWRSKDTGLTRLKGGGDDDYAQAGLTYRPRHAPFQSVDELKLVLGMTPDLFARIRPALTVYSHKPTPDLQVALREALLAFFPNQPDQVKEILAARTQGADNDGLKARPGILTGTDSLAGRTFEIAVTLKTGQRTLERVAVIVLTNDKSKPYIALAWR